MLKNRLLHCWIATWVIAAASPALRAAESGELTILKTGGKLRVAIDLAGELLLTSPEEGLWSIATGWKGGWPTEWVHGSPSEVSEVGDWTILKGHITLDGGKWILTDAYRTRGVLVQCIRRFEWLGEVPADRTTLSIRFQAPGSGEGVVMPGILYHGNPSGAKSGRTPVFEGKPGELAIFEEHRFPMPFVSFEFLHGSEMAGVAIHSSPSPVPNSNLPDQWWSMGVNVLGDRTELLLLTGPCASNGEKSVVKATQRGFLPYENAFLNIESDTVIEKTFFLQAYPVEAAGAGFQRAVKSSLDLFGPFLAERLPSLSEIVSAKLRYAATRWFEKGQVAGFRKYANRNVLVLGWCGQSAAPGYALQLLDPSPTARNRVQKSLDFLSGTEFYEQGFHTWYDPDESSWYQPNNRPEILSQGQAMQNFANAIRIGRANGLETERWERFLRRASEFHASRILSPDWRPLSTNEAFFIAPLIQAHRLFGVPQFAEAAIKAGETYSSRHVSMREPYWGGTLDASCEDKEGAWAALEGFLALFDLTGEQKYLSWAQHAADVVLTYLVVWDIDMPPGRLRNHDFKTRGWTAVSVQNQHIDVYGVLIAPSLYKLGLLTGNIQLQQVALLMYRACGQLVDPHGSQGEQPQHTNYAQSGGVSSPFGLRGGYVEDWTVFWITIHFLNAAAQFKELGVELGVVTG